jgi:hypothetical protein
MPKFMFVGSYTHQGAKGLAKDSQIRCDGPIPREKRLTSARRGR